MTIQVLFIHGGGGGAYEEDRKLAAELQNRLGAEYAVHCPEMPDEEEPDYKTWRGIIAGRLAAFGSGSVLVGHSIGASVAIRAIVDGAVEPPPAGVFLLAAPFWYDDDFWSWPAVQLPANAAERIPDGLPIFVYHGREDEVVPVSHVDMYAKALPRATVRRLDGRNHQLNDDLTEVARDIVLLRSGA